MVPLPQIAPNEREPEAPAPVVQLVEHFFRYETSRLHGALIRLLGVQNLALAEDVAQEALLRALRTWSMGGVPANPSAWITRVAMNLAKDALRHQRMSASKEPAIITYLDQTLAASTVGKSEEHEIRDDALRLMFVCCHPAIATDA
ncbi:MAG TPA: sigma factor, partial [Chthoniobacterales bacterium]|nr:sigma factor [Chthoniobacterales bacterium]